MKHMRSLLNTLIALVAGWLIMTLTTSSALLGTFTQAVIHAVFALGVGFLLKQNGLVSFGHALFFGGAAYAMGVVLGMGWLPAEWAIPVILLGIGLAAFVVGLVIVRVPGIAFGMLTLAIGQMFYLLATRTRGMTGGSDGMGVAWPRTLYGVPDSVLYKPEVMFMVAWVVMVVVGLLLQLLLKTRFGAVTEAIRDNEERARFIGMRTTAPKALVYAISAVVSAIAGLLSNLSSGFVSPESLHWSVSAITLLMVIVGGFQTLLGPIVGAIVYFMVRDILGDYATYSMALFGAALIAVIVYSPHGITGAVAGYFKKKRKAKDAQTAQAQLKRKAA